MEEFPIDYERNFWNDSSYFDFEFNETNYDDFENTGYLNPFEKYTKFTIIILILIIGLTGNAALIWVFINDRQIRCKRNL